MQKLLLICLFTIQMFSCEGDCLKCHPSLVKSGTLDSNHKILSACINCHTIDANDLLKMGSLCGQDCWDCHSANKTMNILDKNGLKVKEHLALNSCIDCHKKMDKRFNLIKELNLQGKI